LVLFIFFSQKEAQKKQEKTTTSKPEIKIVKRNPNPYEKDSKKTPRPDIKIEKRNPNPFEKDTQKQKNTPKTDQKLPRRNLIGKKPLAKIFTTRWRLSTVLAPSTATVAVGKTDGLLFIPLRRGRYY